MGVISRKVLPACGSLCFVCPSLRARSHQPVKRYKKLLVNSFPRSQDGVPNERMVSKLCEYASKNPMRIPKITMYLEKRLLKELQNERVGFVRVVPFIYTKLLRSCKEQISLYASGMLATIKTLLEQSQQDELRILGSNTLVDFLNVQTDSTYMSSVEGLIPKLCQLAQEVGEDERGLSLRSAGLQALASVLHFFGENSHLPTNIDDFVTAALKNYEIPKSNSNQNKKVCEHSQDESHDSSVSPMVDSKSVTTENDLRINAESLMDIPNNPTSLARLCLRNMAALAKEAATLRRVLEPFLLQFDYGNHWSSDGGIALSVLCEMAVLMESGQNNHQLLAMLVKHLDHRNVSKKPSVQARIVDIAAYLAMQMKSLSSVTIIATICDVMRHLRKHMQCFLDSLDREDEKCKWNPALYSALDNFLMTLLNKVGDVGTILDVMAMFLENIPAAATSSRATIAVVYRSVLMLASIPSASSHNREFPEALFHQLLLGMSHGDQETRVASHRVFSAVLVPELNCPWSIPLSSFKIMGSDPAFMAQLVFSSSEVIQEKVQENKNIGVLDWREKLQSSSYRDPEFPHAQLYESNDLLRSSKGKIFENLGTLRLSSHQVDRLLLSIWAQGTSQENGPSCYEAMSHTFCLSVICAESKTSSCLELVRCFQLGFSLRCLSLDEGCSLRPSHRMSLFTLASSMLVFSAKACGNSQLSSSMTEASDGLLHPYLQGAFVSRDALKICNYYSTEDDLTAQKSLLMLRRDVEHLKQMVESHLERYKQLTKEEISSVRLQLSEPFSAEDAILVGTPRLSDRFSGKDLQPMEKILPLASLEDEEAPDETSQNHPRDDFLSADQLIQSVLETSQHVATPPEPSAPVPYDEMKSQSEAVVAGKQQKISTLLTFQRSIGDYPKEQGPPTLVISHKEGSAPVLEAKSEEMRPDHGDGYSSFRLPPSSPFDKFLRAAGIGEQGDVHARH
ncbi:protein SEMI-ROLLED LEAF 2-like isoform X2 [Wolffia australiana]